VAGQQGLGALTAAVDKKETSWHTAQTKT